MPLLGSPVDDMEDMITLNITALTRLAYAVAPGFVARGSATVINISSIVAIAPEILNGVYGGTKAFVLGLSQSMQRATDGRLGALKGKSEAGPQMFSRFTSPTA